MDRMGEFFAMGGYGGFIWPAYGLTAIVLVGLFAVSLRFLRQRQAEIAMLEAEGIEAPHRSGKTGHEA